MKSFVTGLLVLFTSTLAIASPESAVHIKHEAKENNNIGSGTVIACENGKSLILTCGHVVPDQGLKITVTHNGKTYDAKYLTGSKVVEKPHPTIPNTSTLEIDGLDLALIEVEAVLPVAKLAKAPVKKGDKVKQWGFSGGVIENGPFYKEGKVVEESSFWATADARPGDSGTAVYNEAGDIVGVCHARSSDTNLPSVLAIPLDDLKGWLKDNAKTYPKLLKSMEKK